MENQQIEKNNYFFYKKGTMIKNTIVTEFKTIQIFFIKNN